MAFGFVLVGGASSRMGRDKTQLVYRGRPMALHQAEKLAFVCGRVALVGKDPGPFASSGCLFVSDGAEPQAAMYGVLAALAYSPEETNLILAADMPRVPEAFLAALLAEADATLAPAIVPVSGGRPQPLCAVWRRSALHVLTARAAEGELSMADALGPLGALLMSEEATRLMPGGDPDRFLNVNTPEDYALLEDETSPYAPRR